MHDPSQTRLPLSSLLAIALAGTLTAPIAARQQQPHHHIHDPHMLGRASHVVIPQARAIPLHRPSPGGVEIDHVSARVKILHQTARTTLQVALHNTSSTQAEAVLLLPVPAGAVVSGFDFDGSSAEPTARLLPADEARRLYDSIVARVRDPALLEFAGYNLIRSSVFPVPPQGAQKIRLTYEHLLERDGDRVDYVLPRSESLDRRRPWEVQIDLQAAHPISMVYSPSHELTETRLGPSHFSIKLDGEASLEPGSLQLSYLLEEGGVSASLFAYPDPSVGGGYFLLMAGLPARIDQTSRTVRREVTLVLDRSGSMAGGKMDQVRAAALQVIEGLDDGETFNIIDYASNVSMLAPRPVVKNDQSIGAARQYLAALRPGGGTNIHDALLEALRQPASDSMLPIVLFLTDGLPTIGRTSEVTIRQMVTRANVHGRRIFTFGVGADVNAPLLDRIAEQSRATSAYVLPHEDVEVKVAKVFTRLDGPVLARPALRVVDEAGQERDDLVAAMIPAELPDLFDGDQLILLGQYQDEQPITFQLDGEFLGRPKRFQFTFGLDRASTRHAFVPRLWASRRIALLVDQIRQAGAETASQPSVIDAAALADPAMRALVDEILTLSTKWGILTEYTAFLATEGTDLANWEDLRAGCSELIDRRAVRTRSGNGALNQSLNVVAQKGQSKLKYDNSFVNQQMERVQITAVQQVCDRAFFKRGNRWIDSRLIDDQAEPAPQQNLVLGSQEHFELLRKLVGEGRQGVLSLSGEILLLVDGRAVLITTDP